MEGDQWSEFCISETSPSGMEPGVILCEFTFGDYIQLGKFVEESRMCVSTQDLPTSFVGFSEK